MNNRTLFAILPLGILPGVLHLSWAYVVVMFWLWFLIDPSRSSKNLNKLSVILIYLYFVFCCWAIAQYVWLPFIHQYQHYLYGAVLVFFLAYWSNLLLHPQWKKVWVHSLAIIVVSISTVVLVIIHVVLSVWSGLWIETDKWSHYVVSLILILICLFLFQSSHPFKGIPRCLKPLLVVMILVVLFGQYTRWVQLQNSANDSTQYRYAAASAIQSGHIHTAIDAVLNEGAKLSAEGKTAEAITFLRSQWEHLPKEKMAKRFRDHPLTKDNSFLFLSLFGGRLRFTGDEKMVDGILLHQPLRFLIATTYDRLHEVTLAGIELLPYTIKDMHRVHYEPDHQTLYGTTREGQVFFRNKSETIFVSLPNDFIWEDVVLSNTGDRFWAMHTRGGIVEYDLIDGEWKRSRELYPPLWQESDLAVRLLYETIDGQDVFYVLDQCKGISARCPVEMVDQILPKEDLFRFYHPDRRIAIDLKRYDSKWMIADQLGQLDMVQQGIGNDFTEWKYSIRGAIHFERNSGMWLTQDDTVALIAYPQAHTIIQLKRNGVFEPIAMPQGFRLTPLKRNGWWDVHHPIYNVNF